MKKKNKNEKIMRFSFYYTELPAFAEYLQKQEENGYRLKKIEENILTFEKCEPRKIRYCAEIFRSATHEDFIELCKNEGWEFVDVYHGELFVFRTQDEDAIDIMTDQQEKNKACAKRILKQPGIWLCLFYIFKDLLRIFVNVDFNDIFELSIINYIYSVIIALFFFSVFIRIVDYFIWKIKVSRSDSKENSEFFSLKNTLIKRKIYNVFSCLTTIISYGFLIYLCPKFFLKGPILLSALFLIFAYFTNNNFGEIKEKKWRNILSKSTKTIFCIYLFALAFFTIFNNGAERLMKSYSDSLNATYNSQNIPITLSDLGVEAETFENEIRVKGTSLVHFYTVISDAEGLYNEDDDSYMSYNILITDSSYIQQKYIKQILKDYDEYEKEFMKVTSPETQWDYYYKIKHDDETYYNGFAVKDNILVNIDWGVNCEVDFFEVAYDKIFGE